MPNLPSKWLREFAEDGTEFSARVEVLVTADGDFNVSIPPEVKEHYLRMKLPYTQRGRYEPKATASSLDEAVGYVREAIKDYLKVETETRRFIVYRVVTDAPHWIGSDGQTYGNGAYPTPAGEWWTPKTKQKFRSATDRAKIVTVGAVAKVMDRTEYKRASGSVFKWEIPRETGNPNIERLNAFTVVDAPNTESGVEFLDYSDEGAQFFANLMCELSRLARYVDGFFADKERLQEAIDAGKVKLLG